MSRTGFPRFIKKRLRSGPNRTGPVSPLPGIVCKRATTYLQEFLAANSVGVVAGNPSGEGRSISWQRPPCGTLKINVDGSWKKGERRGSFGIVIRDSQSVFVAASMGISQWCASSTVAEALAVRQGILLGSQLGLGSVILESDAQLIVDMINGRIAVSQEVEVIIHDIQVMRVNFQCCIFSFVRRTGNNVAHVLASKSLSGLGIVVGLSPLRRGCLIPCPGTSLLPDVSIVD